MADNDDEFRVLARAYFKPISSLFFWLGIGLYLMSDLLTDWSRANWLSFLLFVLGLFFAIISFGNLYYFRQPIKVSPRGVKFEEMRLPKGYDYLPWEVIRDVRLHIGYRESYFVFDLQPADTPEISRAFNPWISQKEYKDVAYDADFFFLIRHSIVSDLNTLRKKYRKSEKSDLWP